jgi:GNAT superfamily N-acetyltransferase
MDSLSVRALDPDDIQQCDEILRSLPEWFGIEQSIADYVRRLDSMPGVVALVEDRIVGFLAVHHHNLLASEIHVMAVRRAHHRRGVGRAMVREIERQARTQGRRLLQVKTLGPSDSDRHYARTRAFYEAMGFVPLEETVAFWGPENPTLILVKALQR